MSGAFYRRPSVGTTERSAFRRADAVARSIRERMIATPMEAASTLAALAPPLPQEKARAALRRLMQGQGAAPEWFRGHGMPLSKDEIARLEV